MPQQAQPYAPPIQASPQNRFVRSSTAAADTSSTAPIPAVDWRAKLDAERRSQDIQRRPATLSSPVLPSSQPARGRPPIQPATSTSDQPTVTPPLQDWRTRLDALRSGQKPSPAVTVSPSAPVAGSARIVSPAPITQSSNGTSRSPRLGVAGAVSTTAAPTVPVAAPPTASIASSVTFSTASGSKSPSQASPGGIGSSHTLASTSVTTPVPMSQATPSSGASSTRPVPATSPATISQATVTNRPPIQPVAAAASPSPSPSPSLSLPSLNVSGIAGTYATPSAPYQPTLSLSGSALNTITKITWSWSGPNSGTSTWQSGSSNWSKFSPSSDGRSATVQPGLVASTDPVGVYQWVVTFVAGSQQVSQSYTVNYSPPAAAAPPPPPPSLSVSGIGGTYSTSIAPYQPTIDLSGSALDTVTKIKWSWSGPNSGTSTWQQGSSNWNKFSPSQDGRSATVQPGLVASNDLAGTYNWTVTFYAPTQNISRSFVVNYSSPIATLPLSTPSMATAGSTPQTCTPLPQCANFDPEALSALDTLISITSACLQHHCVNGTISAGAKSAIETVLTAARIVAPLDQESRTYQFAVNGGQLLITVVSAVAKKGGLEVIAGPAGDVLFVTELLFRPTPVSG